MTHYLKPIGSPASFEFFHQNLTLIPHEIDQRTADFASRFFANVSQDRLEESASVEENFIDILTTSQEGHYLGVERFDECYLEDQEDVSFEDQTDAFILTYEPQEEVSMIDSFSSSATSSLAPSPTLGKRKKTKTSQKKDYHIWTEEDFSKLEMFCKNKLYRTNENKYAVKEICKHFNVSDRVCRNGITTLQRRGVLPKWQRKRNFY
jgi:hypothetical protein